MYNKEGRGLRGLVGQKQIDTVRKDYPDVVPHTFYQKKRENNNML